MFISAFNEADSMFPQIKKKIQDFITEEQGKITKKAIIRIGILAAISSAFAPATRAAEEATNDGVVTTNLIGSSGECEADIPTGTAVSITAYCNGNGHNNGTWGGHDSSDAQVSADIQISGNIGYSRVGDNKIFCPNDHEHDDRGCGHVSSHGECKVVINAPTHTNSVALSENENIITASHDHSIGNDNPTTLCLGREEFGYAQEDCHGSGHDSGWEC
jgi:hypothetical protein